MEKLDIFDCSDVMIASFFTDDRGCAHENRDHTLIYLLEGELEITDNNGKKTVLHPGECAFMRRDHRVWLQKHASPEKPYRSVVLKFTRNFLRDVFKGMNREELPESKRDKRSLMLLPAGRPDIKSLFESIVPYFEAEIKPAEEILKMKMLEGLYVLLNTDKSLYASLFDFTVPWKIDLLQFMNDNFMHDLSMEELASYSGRSLATFKREFKTISDLSPQKWIIRRRLEAARELIAKGTKKVSEICYEVGFKNLSHFSKIYKETYGVSPINTI